MKATIKKTITQEIELPLPYYASNGCTFYKIVSENPFDNVKVGCYEHSGEYEIKNFAPAYFALSEGFETISVEEFYQKYTDVLNKLRHRIYSI
jgi:hypothetical protein